MTAATKLQKTRQQVRNFVIVWSLVTLGMGFATFLAIYFTYGSQNTPPSNEVALNSALALNSDNVLIASQTPLPATATNTQVPTLPATIQPTLVAQVAPTEAPSATPIPATATTAPAFYTGFEVGIQVQYSLDYNPETQDGYYRLAADQLQMQWVKTQVRWEDFEPEPDVYNWSVLDLVMPSAQRFGIQQVLSVVTAPDWAREPGVDLSKHGPPANNQDYVDFVLKMIDRYPGQIGAIEVWNETNIDREWTSTQGLSAADYVSLLRDTYNAVKAVDPGILIIIAAPAPTGLNDGVGAWDDFVYVDQLIAAGAMDVADCLGVHLNGYNLAPMYFYDEGYNDPTATFRGPFDNPHHSWSFRSTLKGYADRIRAAGETTPLCVTEFGWAVAEDLERAPANFGFAVDNTLAEQAEWMPIALQLMEESGYVRMAIVWNLNYGPQAGYSPDNDNVPYSLIGPNFSFRPAYTAIELWMAEFNQRRLQR
jgi:polysaccharide biosynthesis protein PslG